MSDKVVDRTIENNPEEPVSNFTSNRYFADIIQARYSRRTMLKGSLGAAAVTFLGAGLVGCGGDSDNDDDNGGDGGDGTPPRLSFDAIATSRQDAVVVPEGYTAKAFVPWGTPILGSYPAYMDDGGNTGADQSMQVGMHHDGMHFFPLEGSSEHGLLVMNHEYVDQITLHPNGPSEGPRPLDEVRKEMAAHGVSVIEVQKSSNGDWEVVPSALNRRINAFTVMALRGPARGHDLVKTAFSPEGTRTRGTINNCANGFTPWGTYLTCEENWPGYFHVRMDPQPRHLARYGVTGWQGYHWYDVLDEDSDLYTRFQPSESGDDATQDFRNEPNGFGWIVEIDPHDPDAMPIKRTALGRFSHEGVVFAEPKVGEPMVFYSGDDARFEYIYKFVSKNLYQEGMTGNDLMDEGTLYVARFNDDGSGEWLPLSMGDDGFVAKMNAAVGTTVGSIEFDEPFADQGELLINTRLAADIAGATRMDRPEWGAVCPRTGMVYFTLTNNSNRTEDDTDAANPRAANQVGQIIRWQEDGAASASTFQWDLFALGGHLEGSEQEGRSLVADAALTAENIFSCPDGLWFDGRGLLWIQTDMSGSMQDGSSDHGDFGNNQMLVAEPDTGLIKRFLVGPTECEVTGITMTPDHKTLFVNIQHPGDRSEPGDFTSHWPDGGSSRPRSSTVVVTRDDGGEIGIA